MDDKELETKIYNYFDYEVPEPNQQILNELKTKMHQRTTSSPKKSYKKFRLALVSCIAVILLIPAVTLPIILNSNNPPPDSNDTPPLEEEIYYSDSNLTMVDLTQEALDSILVGKFSKYATLLEDYTINMERAYYGEDNTIVYICLEMTKNDIPFTWVELNIVFVNNYEHNHNEFFNNVSEFTQYDNCKLYEIVITNGYKKEYRKYIEFEDYKVYLRLDKQDSSIVNAIIQN